MRASIFIIRGTRGRLTRSLQQLIYGQHVNDKSRQLWSDRLRLSLLSSTSSSAYNLRLISSSSSSSSPSPTSSCSSQDDEDKNNRVVIVGGGPSGLFMSLLLSKYHVPHTLLEQQSVTQRFQHPQAHFLNTRTMELLDYWFPQLYHDIRTAMPPVNQWNQFRFVTNMSQDPPLAQVQHPVHIPLQAQFDANGVLVPASSSTSKSTSTASSTDLKDKFLSPCSVGHLAQDAFGQILYDHAIRQESYAQLHYESKVLRVTNAGEDREVVHIQYQSTSSKHNNKDGIQTLISPLCIGADGAHSFVRQSLNITQSGQSNIQHLINIHVILPEHVARQLHTNNNYAMLYSIFSTQVVAMAVCHSLGNYILQIPYFPPYQTLEQDFNVQRVHAMLQSIFGPSIPNQSWTIESVRPWCMNALVSNEYYKGRIALVGDAAHVFPPAGGFGMNTGLQDVHNLAWRIAGAFHNNNNNHTQPSLHNSQQVQQLLQAYEKDRKPIAQENAALSVRNYHRLLQVMKSCNLDDAYPTNLVRVLDHMMPLVPFPVKQSLFRNSYRLALSSLSALDTVSNYLSSPMSSKSPASLYAYHITRKLQQVLKSGAGLPLLFPRYELGYQYNHPRAKDENDDQQHSNNHHDTWADAPTLQVGRLVPHVRVQVLHGSEHFTNLRVLPPITSVVDSPHPSDSSSNSTCTPTTTLTISTCNIPAQLSLDGTPTYVLLYFGVGDDATVHLDLSKLQLELSTHLGFPVQSACVMDSYTDHTSRPWEGALALRELPSAYSFVTNVPPSIGRLPYVVLIRPDSHIERIESISTNDVGIERDGVAKTLLGKLTDANT